MTNYVVRSSGVNIYSEINNKLAVIESDNYERHQRKIKLQKELIDLKETIRVLEVNIKLNDSLITEYNRMDLVDIHFITSGPGKLQAAYVKSPNHMDGVNYDMLHDAMVYNGFSPISHDLRSIWCLPRKRFHIKYDENINVQPIIVNSETPGAYAVSGIIWGQ